MFVYLLSLQMAHARDSISLLISDDIEEFEDTAQSFIDNAPQDVQVFRIKGDRGNAYRIAEELKSDQPPLIVAIGAKAAWTARQKLPQIPMIYTMVDQPERYGLNGATVTGISIEAPPDLILSQFRLFAPEVRDLGIFTSADINDPLLESSKKTAEDFGFGVTVYQIDSNKDVRKALVYVHKTVDAIWLLPDEKVITPENFYSINTAASRNHMPTLANSELLVTAGALIGVTADYNGVGSQAAQVAKQILEGDASMYGQILYPENSQVVINLDTMDTINLDVDPMILSFANKHISSED
jgi:putative tryptophan/tyrosine transport system substrate-binding protein